jgi:hypothetical protein
VTLHIDDGRSLQHFAAIDPRSTPLAKQALKVGTLFAFIYNAERKHIYGRSERKRKEKEHVSFFYNILFVSEHIQHACKVHFPHDWQAKYSACMAEGLMQNEILDVPAKRSLGIVDSS